MPLNIFKDGSRPTLPSLLPQNLASKTNVSLVTVPKRRVLLMLYMKIIQPFFFLLDIPQLISTRITFAALFTAPHRVCIQWVVHNPPSVLDTTTAWQKTFAFCLYLMWLLPCRTYDFAFDFAAEQTLLIKKPKWGSTTSLITSRNCYSAHFGVMATLYHQGF